MSQPSETAVKTLFAHSRNLCFYERCEERLTDPRWKRVNARIAHIKGEHPGSARYDPNQPDVERQGYENLMLLCPKHHTLIDDLLPDDHPVELLREMRRKHLEHEAARDWAGEAELEYFTRDAMIMNGYVVGPAVTGGVEPRVLAENPTVYESLSSPGGPRLRDTAGLRPPADAPWVRSPGADFGFEARVGGTEEPSVVVEGAQTVEVDEPRPGLASTGD